MRADKTLAADKKITFTGSESDLSRGNLYNTRGLDHTEMEK
jgi:hypothetical protein